MWKVTNFNWQCELHCDIWWWDWVKSSDLRFSVNLRSSAVVSLGISWICSAKRTIHNVPHSPNASCFGLRLSWQQWRQQAVTVIQCRAAYVTYASSPSQVGLTTINEVNWHQNISCSWGKNKQVTQRTADKKKKQKQKQKKKPKQGLYLSLKFCLMLIGDML